jgi:VanZ family protein
LSIILYGFLFAGLTEIIQLYTPGRAGVMSDVFIDYSGYMTSVGIIVLIYFIIEYIKFKKEVINIIIESTL